MTVIIKCQTIIVTERIKSKLTLKVKLETVKIFLSAGI